MPNNRIIINSYAQVQFSLRGRPGLNKGLRKLISAGCLCVEISDQDLPIIMIDKRTAGKEVSAYDPDYTYIEGLPAYEQQYLLVEMIKVCALSYVRIDKVSPRNNIGANRVVNVLEAPLPIEKAFARSILSEHEKHVIRRWISQRSAATPLESIAS